MQDKHPESLMPLARQIDVVVRDHKLGAMFKGIIELPGGRSFTTDQLNSLQDAILRFVEGLCKTNSTS